MSEEIEILPTTPKETTTIGHPLEKAIVGDMQRIVRGDVQAVPRFVRDLMKYFEDGTRPSMTPAEFSHHLTQKACFVLTALFQLPEAQQQEAGEKPNGRLSHKKGQRGGVEITELDDNSDPSADRADARSDASPDTPPDAASAAPDGPVAPDAPPPAPSFYDAEDDADDSAWDDPRDEPLHDYYPPRWFDVFVGSCALTAAYKFSFATLIMQCLSMMWPSWDSSWADRSTAPLLVILTCLCVDTTTVVAFVGDALMIVTAFGLHRSHYTASACAWASLGAVSRMMLR